MPFCSISADYARSVFAYDPETGAISRNIKTSSSAEVGCIIGRDNGDGYSRVSVMGKRVYVHRLAWLLHYGEWPANQIDHVDGDRSNNKIANLRDVDRTANAQNIHVANSNTGVLGVSYDANRKRYVAQISVGPRGSAKTIHLGRYRLIEDAQRAYLIAKSKYHPSACIAV